MEFVTSWLQPTPQDTNARSSLRIGSFITVKDGLIIQDIAYFDRQELMENMSIDVSSHGSVTN
ncbi:MAG: hypothetical protein ACI9R7_001035 [Lysobacterales bacterium]